MRLLVFVVGCALLVAACGKTQATPNAKTERTTPVCAVQDCKTHQIIDDGCTKDTCVSCINACPMDRDE